jgi:PAS domain S-box-containing protein
MSLIAILPALTVILYTQSTERSRAEAQAVENTLRTSRRAAARQASTFTRASRFLSSLGQTAAMQSAKPATCNDVMPPIVREHLGYINLGVIDPDGTIVCAAVTGDPARFSPEAIRGRPWFQRVMHTRAPAVGDYATGVRNAEPAIVVASPVIGPSGSVERILSTTIALEGLDWAVSGLDIPAGATLVMFDRRGTILTGYPDAGRWIGTRVPEALAARRADARGHLVESVGGDGVRRLYAVEPVTAEFETGLSVAMGVPRTAAFVETNRVLRRQLSLLLLVSLAAIAVGFVGGEFFVGRPVATLTAVTARLSTGEFTARAELEGGVPGMSELGSAINGMAAALEARRRERDLAEKLLRASEARHRQLFEQNPHPAWVYDAETLAILAVNQCAVDEYGYTVDEFLTLTIKDLHSRNDWPLLDQHPAQGAATYRGEWQHRTKDGHVRDVDVRANLIDWNGRPARLALIEDTTERKQLEAQLRQSQKMEAIGQLAGGVAHDFNNLLTVIQGYAELLANNFADDDSRREDVNEITRATQRAAALTRQLLAFSRKQILTPRVLHLGDIVGELTPMLRRVIGETIDLQTSTADRSRIKADANQLEQVIMNLVVNARDAMREGGRLGIQTADVSLDDDFARLHPPLRSGPFVSLTVTDTGEGMDAATQGRIFEPFFTTKPKGEGTGLGLSTVYGIVQQSGGHILVSSEAGRGSTFTVYLPQTSDAADAVQSVPHARRDFRGTETILLVEDEETVRQLVGNVLTRQGYTVHAAARPSAALEFARNYVSAIQLVMTDVVLPDMNGRILASELLLLHPESQVLYMSGYTGDAFIHEGVLEPGTWFLQKPFTNDALVKSVREILDLTPAK